MFDTNESTAICHRCGFCCKNFNAAIPADIDSDLSPDYLNRLSISKGFEYMESYFKNHTLHQGERCKWLIDKADGTTACSVYGKRGIECRRYPYSTVENECETGRIWITKRHSKGPEDLHQEMLVSIFERMTDNIYESP